MSKFLNLTGESTSDFDIHWNSPPKAIGRYNQYSMYVQHNG